MTNTQIADLVRLKHRYAGGAFREPGATSASRRCEIENKHRKKEAGAVSENYRIWTAEEVQILTEQYPHVATCEVARILGRKVTQVIGKAHRLRLKKSPAYQSTLGNNLSSAGAATRFRPGQVPWNYGTHFVSGGRSAETRFKPGQKTHTWRPIGAEHITKNGYIERKIADTGTRRDYVLVHHLVWREAGREIPNGHVLIFIDGDKRNFALDNLKLISRQELMHRNSIHNLGPEIAQLIQLCGAISRQINKRKGEIS